ncbi:putative nucleotidyltransferase, ribonuclease H [Tanacetum coccineum]
MWIVEHPGEVSSVLLGTCFLMWPGFRSIFSRECMKNSGPAILQPIVSDFRTYSGRTSVIPPIRDVEFNIEPYSPEMEPTLQSSLIEFALIERSKDCYYGLDETVFFMNSWDKFVIVFIDGYFDFLLCLKKKTRSISALFLQNFRRRKLSGPSFPECDFVEYRCAFWVTLFQQKESLWIRRRLRLSPNGLRTERVCRRTIVSGLEIPFRISFLDKVLTEKSLGKRHKFSTAFHPVTDGQSEVRFKTLVDMLRSCALDWTGIRMTIYGLVEFATITVGIAEH